MKVLAVAGATIFENAASAHAWPVKRPSNPRELPERSLRSITSELARTATECSTAELPEVLAELAAAQAVALQRIVAERVVRGEDERPLSWAEAAVMSGGLQLTPDWLKKNRHKLDFCIRVSRKKWFISEKRFKTWLEARRRRA
jgi:hypothetical protein